MTDNCKTNKPNQTQFLLLASLASIASLALKKGQLWRTLGQVWRRFGQVWRRLGLLLEYKYAKKPRLIHQKQ
ncbi:MAG: hypothetical protein ACYSOW_04200 [Planctomycetota bacterium]|jgi:hypothetical protein